MTGLLTLFAVALALLVAGGTLGVSWLLARPPRLTAGRAIAMGLPTEPGDVGLDGYVTEFTLRDGVRLPGFVLEGRDPRGPSVVMLHGLLESRYASLSRAAVLADFASRMILPDLRGHGEASRSLCHGGTTEADDAIEILDQLDVPGPIVLHGFSLGAGIALATAAAVRARDKENLTHNEQGDRHRLVGVVAEGVYRRWHTPLRNFLWYYRIPPWPFVPLLRLINEPRDPRLRRFDRARDAAGIDVPLLMIHGESDGLCDPAYAREVADAAAGPATFVTIPGAGHMNVATHDPDRYRAALAGFFKQIVGVASASPSAESSLTKEAVS